MAPNLKDELKKRNAFDSLEQEAALAIWRTADLLGNRFARLLRDNNLTPSQYNVLRILRGEGKPLPCLEIASRMLQVAPAITRVVEQLLQLEMVTKTQSDEDRRVFVIDLTPQATTLLKKLDKPVLDLHAKLMKGIPATDLKSLIRVLDLVRATINE